MSCPVSQTDKSVAFFRWLKQIRETTNTAFLPLLFNKSRYLVLKGGGGSGKSVFAGRKILERCTTEPGHRYLVVRKVARTLRESCFEQLRNQAREFYSSEIDFIPAGKGADMYIRFRNGSEILFAGLDDVEKLKSIYDITGIWVEEASEITESDFNQLDIRLRTEFPYYLQMILTFNPISITHWLKKRFFDRKDERATVHESTYKDNRFLTPEAIRTLEAFRDTDEYYYSVYCLGQWGTTGRTVFDGKAVGERIEAVRTLPFRRGYFDATGEEIRIDSYSFVEDKSGGVKIFAEPEAGRPYVIGADTAGDGSDYFVAQVLDNITGKQVAVLRQQTEEDTFARQLYCLGRFYNDALIAVETNFSTYPVKMLDLMRYPKQYVREVEDSFDGKIRHSFGFRTDSLTRPVILSELIRVMRDNVSLISDTDTLEEMLTFVRNEKLRPEAEAGAHDDCVMSLAIAFYVRPKQTSRLTEKGFSRSRWTKRMKEDYRRATPEEKDFLLRKWADIETTAQKKEENDLV